MSPSEQSLIPASSEFIALCQSQIALLTQGLGAAWSVVYLTQELTEGTQAQLIPVVAYPEKASVWQTQANIRLTSESLRGQGRVRQLPSLSLTTSQAHSIKESFAHQQLNPKEGKGIARNHQIVSPIIYEEVAMGLLVTGREDRDWSTNELAQIEKIVQTLAIACHLDQKQIWYQKKLQEQLNLYERLDDWLHQLRNPLTALRTFGKLLIKRLLSSDRDRKIAESIVRESEHLQELLQQFDTWLDDQELQTPTLTLNTTAAVLPQATAKPTSPLLVSGDYLELEPVAIREILAPLIASTQAIAQENKIQFTADIPDNLTPVLANGKGLREVFNNLLNNALKYTPAGGIVSLTAGIISYQNECKYQGIVISDSGVGIPLEDQEHIFERHYRGIQAKGTIPGSGLGLAIVREILEQMQGEIELISPNYSQNEALAQGTTFIVWLPIATG